MQGPFLPPESIKATMGRRKWLAQPLVVYTALTELLSASSIAKPTLKDAFIASMPGHCRGARYSCYD